MTITLFLFGNAEAARDAGFRQEGSHTQDYSLKAWWPSRPLDAMRGLEYTMVVVTPSAKDDPALMQKPILQAKALLRLWPQIWMEL